MLAGRSDLEGALRVLLPFHFSEIDVVMRSRLCKDRVDIDMCTGIRAAIEQRNDFMQSRSRENLDARGNCCFSSIRHRHNDPLQAIRDAPQDNRQILFARRR